jgi:hypothetical protein
MSELSELWITSSIRRLKLDGNATSARADSIGCPGFDNATAKISLKNIGF